MIKPKVYGLLYRFFVLVICLFLVAPVFIVVLISFNSSESLTINLLQPSLQWYRGFFNSANFRNSFVTSLQIAAVTAVSATLLAVPAAYALLRFNFRGRSAIQAFILSPVMIPAIILGVALLNLYFIIEVRGTFASIVLAHVVLTTPYVIRTVSASLSGLDLGIEEAAIGLGASRLRTFFEITLPLMRSGVIAGMVFVFVLSFGELDATLYLTSPHVSTLPVQVFSELTWTSNPVVAAASVFQILIITVGILLMERTVGITKAARF